MVVGWFPVGTVEERQQWTFGHPVLAGCYFGVLCGAGLGLFFGLDNGLKAGTLAGLVSGLLAGVMFAVLVRARCRSRFERPDADRFPQATRARPWSRASSRFIFWMLILGLGGAIAWVVGVADGSNGVPAGVIGIGVSTWLIISLASELRRRRSGEEL